MLYSMHHISRTASLFNFYWLLITFYNLLSCAYLLKAVSLYRNLLPYITSAIDTKASLCLACTLQSSLTAVPPDLSCTKLETESCGVYEYRWMIRLR